MVAITAKNESVAAAANAAANAAAAADAVDCKGEEFDEVRLFLCC